MQKVQKFMSEIDGKLFDDEQECLDHEEISEFYVETKLIYKTDNSS